MPPLTISGRGKGTDAAASRGRGEGAGTVARGGSRTGAAANVQQWLAPRQIRCALGNLARASPSVMQAGEPYASDDPIMIATARMGIMRTVIAIALLKKRSPGHRRPGPIRRLFRPCFWGQTAVVSDAFCRFQNANDAPPPDAQNVTASRKSCEVPSFPSFPQTRWNQRFSCVLSALRPSKQPTPINFIDRASDFLALAWLSCRRQWRNEMDKARRIASNITKLPELLCKP